MFDLRAALDKLVVDKRIKIKDNQHLRLDNSDLLSPGDNKNTYRDLDNLPINAKITNEEKEKLQVASLTIPKKSIIGSNEIMLMKNGNLKVL